MNPGDQVLWHHEMRGGYGYVEIIPVTVIRAGPVAAIVQVQKWDGTMVRRRVKVASLHAVACASGAKKGPRPCESCSGTGKRPFYSAGEEMVAGFEPCKACGGYGAAPSRGPETAPGETGEGPGAPEGKP
jgi:hypothetical protein